MPKVFVWPEISFVEEGSWRHKLLYTDSDMVTLTYEEFEKGKYVEKQHIDMSVDVFQAIIQAAPQLFDLMKKCGQ